LRDHPCEAPDQPGDAQHQQNDADHHTGGGDLTRPQSTGQNDCRHGLHRLHWQRQTVKESGRDQKNAKAR